MTRALAALFALAAAPALAAEDPLAAPFATIVSSPAQLQSCRAADAPSSSSHECKWLLADAEWPAYAAIVISGGTSASGKATMSGFAAALDRKKSERDRLVKLYSSLIDGAAPDRKVAASCRVAETLLEYVRALRAGEEPKVLANNPEALDLFRAELENMAFPIEQQAIAALKQTAELASKHKVVSPHAARCQRQLDMFTKVH